MEMILTFSDNRTVKEERFKIKDSLFRRIEEKSPNWDAPQILWYRHRQSFGGIDDWEPAFRTTSELRLEQRYQEWREKLNESKERGS